MNSLEKIAGSEHVIHALGTWPTFHDAEVIAFSAERAIPVSDQTLAKLTIHVRRHQSISTRMLATSAPSTSEIEMALMTF